MSAKKQKRIRQIQYDDQGRLIFNRGPFGKNFLLTEEQASELQPLLASARVWEKSFRRWMIPYVIIVNIPAMVLVGVVGFSFTILAIFGLFTLGAIAWYVNTVKQPWYREITDLSRYLHKNAPRV